MFAGEGAQDYLGEPVSVAVHMRQAGALAEAAGAPPEQVAAALLHDVGHILGGTVSGRELMAGHDNRHGEAGAAWLTRWFGPEVTEPVRLHVAAKRYLCAAEPDYFAKLSPDSVRSLALQGGPMCEAEVAVYRANRYADAATQLRRFDEAAKVKDLATPSVDHFLPYVA